MPQIFVLTNPGLRARTPDYAPVLITDALFTRHEAARGSIAFRCFSLEELDAVVEHLSVNGYCRVLGLRGERFVATALRSVTAGGSFPQVVALEIDHLDYAPALPPER
jgi:hypothetical protein